MSDELHRDLVRVLKDWTEDSDRCDMEGREDEVAVDLRVAVAGELRRVADQVAGTDYGRVAAQVLHQRADEVISR